MHQDDDLVRLAKWVRYFALTWSDSRYFKSGVFDHEEVLSWMSGCMLMPSSFSQDEIDRTGKVMRKLRRMSVREYEVMYRVLIDGQTCDQAASWLSERAVLNNIPLPEGRREHYRGKDALAMLRSATEWCLTHW